MRSFFLIFLLSLFLIEKTTSFGSIHHSNLSLLLKTKLTSYTSSHSSTSKFSLFASPSRSSRSSSSSSSSSSSTLNQLLSNQKIISTNLPKELSNSFLQYSLSTILQRAIPDIRDGLKPVQRRVLYSMYTLGLFPNTSPRKCARIVGEILGKYHPHGDDSVYQCLIRLSQDYLMNYPLVIGQGNFGSLDHDKPAAMRYTEAKLSLFSMKILFNTLEMNKNIIKYIKNFDMNEELPEILINKLPLILLNGCFGIAVGMKSMIPSHNLNEISNSIIYLLKNEIQFYHNLINNTTNNSLFSINSNSTFNSVTTNVNNTSSLLPINLFEDKYIEDLTKFHQSSFDYMLDNIVQGPDYPTGLFLLLFLSLPHSMTHNVSHYFSLFHSIPLLISLIYFLFLFQVVMSYLQRKIKMICIVKVKENSYLEVRIVLKKIKKLENIQLLLQNYLIVFINQVRYHLLSLYLSLLSTCFLLILYLHYF